MVVGSQCTVNYHPPLSMEKILIQREPTKKEKERGKDPLLVYLSKRMPKILKQPWEYNKENFKAEIEIEHEDIISKAKRPCNPHCIYRRDGPWRTGENDCLSGKELIPHYFKRIQNSKILAWEEMLQEDMSDSEINEYFNCISILFFHCKNLQRKQTSFIVAKCYILYVLV